MAGKHQIWSSQKKTRQKAHRCWRRQAKQRMQEEPLQQDRPTEARVLDEQSLKEGPIIFQAGEDIGTNIGRTLSEARQRNADMTDREFQQMIARWAQCSVDEFRLLMPELASDRVEEQFTIFHATPLDYFLSLNPRQQARFVAWLRSSQ